MRPHPFTVIGLISCLLVLFAPQCGSSKSEEGSDKADDKADIRADDKTASTKTKTPKAVPSKPVAMPKADKMVVILVDTLRADRLGCYGYDQPTSPTIDKIAAEGMLFETVISASPWTAPSFGSVLTGVSPTVHGAGAMLARGSSKGTDVLGVTVGGIRKDLPTLPELMPDEMTTAAFITNAFVCKEMGMARGFDHYDHRNASVHHYRAADEVTDKALAWLEANGEKPFFMLLHYFDPHMGYGPPKKYMDEFAPNKPRRIRVPFTDHEAARNGSLNPSDAEKVFIGGLYNGEIRFVDDQIKRVVEAMSATKRLDDTWLVVLSDHGEELFEHGSFEHGHAYENEVIRVPLIIRAPKGEWHKGERVSSTARHVDVTVTLLDLLGQPVPTHMEGASLVPMIEGKETDHRVAYTEFNLFNGQQCSLFDGRYKVVWDIRRKKGFFYDHETDPKEQTRLTSKDPRYKALQARLQAKRMQLAQAAKGKIFEKGVLSPEAAKALKSLGYIE